MKLFEMEGFLRGKCLPGDMKVNETNAEYLVRKFTELEQKLAESQREFRAADATIENLQMQVEKLAAENAGLLPKAASELSNAWVLHKYLIGIQAAIMYLDNGNKKASQEWLYGTIAGPGFEFPGEVDDIEAWAKHQMRGSISHPQALEIIKAETPATNAFLAEVRAQGLNAFIQHHSAELDAHIKNGGEQFDEKSVRIRDIIVSARLFREQIRKGVQ
ncbi:hNH endonuclease [Enterobacter kobei]|uniref:hNH endonuclease n=1 Tax=Enterobacter kobei TaxID=208224 RepID=UPI0013E9306D|nr:hNH endonuclease [Enterobacter kobei]MCA1256244.1 hNH endonuclease [Enterobacter kobei]